MGLFKYESSIKIVLSLNVYKVACCACSMIFLFKKYSEAKRKFNFCCQSGNSIAA